MPRIHLARIAVADGDIDLYEHVNNLAYLRWMQDVATAHSAAQGWTLERYRDAGAAWFARSHHIEYLLPAHRGDTLLLHTWIGEMKPGSCVRRFLFLRESDRRVVATAQTRWAFVDLASGRPTRIPAVVSSAFEVVPDDDPQITALARPAKSPASRVEEGEA